MPRRVTMRPRNSRPVSVFLLTLGLLSLPLPAQNTTAPEPPPRSSQPAAPPAPASDKPQTAVPSSAPGQEPGSDSGTFVFHSDVQEVVLHATVIDDKQRMVTTLDQNAFTIFE